MNDEDAVSGPGGPLRTTGEGKVGGSFFFSLVPIVRRPEGLSPPEDPVLVEDREPSRREYAGRSDGLCIVHPRASLSVFSGRALPDSMTSGLRGHKEDTGPSESYLHPRL